MSFIAANKVCTSTNKTTIVSIDPELFSLPGVDASHLFVGAWALGCFHSHISTQTFWGALTASVDSCAEIKSVTPSIAFRHLPPNSAETGYASEGALFISAPLSTDAVGALRKVWVLI